MLDSSGSSVAVVRYRVPGGVVDALVSYYNIISTKTRGVYYI